jgi:soluble lytic murein transglycosylase
LGMIKRLIKIIIAAGVLLLLAALLGFLLIKVYTPDWYLRWRYPLKYTEQINASAKKNGLDPALVAAVIHQESNFNPDSESEAGAVGLMQLMPDTAIWIAGKTGGDDFSLVDLTDADVNIAYGCWYLSYLVDRYDGSETLALAAYNGGAENVDGWMSQADSDGREFSSTSDIPFEETRLFIADVTSGREVYQKAYAAELQLKR